MMHMIVGTVARRARWVLAAVALLATAPPLWAQGTTGKIEGTVNDQAGQPVSGAQVVVVGTSLGAVTDERGYFFINNAPAGVHSLRAQFIGLQPAEVRNIRVLVGQTMTVNFRLSAAVQIGGISVVVETQPLVPRDQVTSKPVVTGEVVADLPTDDIRGALAGMPGVVETGRADGLIVRGGRAGEAAVYVDGALVRSVMTGGSELEVGTNGVEEASVTTGAFGAEFGDAQSGIISFVTRAGGQSFDGSFAYETDEPFGDAISVGHNRFEGSFGGPLFGNLTFFLAGTLEGRESNTLSDNVPWGKGSNLTPVYVIGGIDTTVTVARGTRGDSVAVEIPRFVQYSGQCDPADNFNFECQGRRRPFNWATEASANAKLQYTYGGSRISGTVLGSRDVGRNYPGGQNMFAPQRYTGTQLDSRAYILNWTQQVLRGTDRELNFDVNVSYQTDRSITGALDRAYETSSRDPALGISLKSQDFLVDFDHFSDDTGPNAITQLKTDADFDKLVSNVRRNIGTRVPYLNRTDLDNSQPYRMNPYAFASAFRNQGLNFAPALFTERRMTGRVNMDLQFDRYNRFKFGADGQTGRVNRFSGSSLIEQIFMEAYAEEPKRYGAYGEDRLDLGDVVVVLGLRWDYFNTGALYPRVPGRIFSLPGVNPMSPEDSMLKVKAHGKLSPRVQVSFPVTDRTGFRLSYSHQAQTPDFGSILQGINNDISFTNSNDIFSGDVDFGKTIQFEFGIRHAFSNDMVLDIAAFNKDKVSDLAVRTQPFNDPGTRSIQNYNVITNSDFGNVRGVDVSLVRRVGNYFNGTMAYTFQIARGTGSDPFSYLNTSARQTSAVTGERVDPPQAILPTDDNRTHNLTGSLALSFPTDFARGNWYAPVIQGLGLFAKFRFSSGLPYTRIINNGGGQQAPFSNFGLSATAVEPINASSMPWIKNVDLRLTKGVRLGPTDVTVFGDFRNVLNFTNVTSVFLETGDIRNEEHRRKLTDNEINTLELGAGARLISLPAGSALRSERRGDQGTRDTDPLMAVDLRPTCASYPERGAEYGPVNCILLRRAEARFGNGNNVFDEHEYTAAFNAYYDLIWGTPTNLGQPRHIRVGLELNF